LKEHYSHSANFCYFLLVVCSFNIDWQVGISLKIPLRLSKLLSVLQIHAHFEVFCSFICQVVSARRQKSDLLHYVS